MAIVVGCQGILIGCGNGEYTVGLAEKIPKRNFIGIDIKGDRLNIGSTYALEKGLKNVSIDSNTIIVNSVIGLVTSSSFLY